MTVTVERQNTDAGSLLNLYRRLIHLRHDNEALAAGRLVPLSSGNASVAAYLRRSDDHIVLVVANLGSATTSGVALDSPAGTLAPGKYRLHNLLGGADGGSLVVGADGRLRGKVMRSGSLDARQSLVLELSRR
jgi:hypothetical protein